MYVFTVLAEFLARTNPCTYVMMQHCVCITCVRMSCSLFYFPYSMCPSLQIPLSRFDLVRQAGSTNIGDDDDAMDGADP